jgi:chromosome segregation ATPase
LSLALQEAHAQAERAAHSGDAARAEAEQKVQQLEESIRELQQQGGGSAVEAESLRAELAKKQETMKKAAQTLKDLKAEKKALEQTVEALQQGGERLGVLEAEAEHLRSEVHRMEAAAEEAGSSCAHLTAEVLHLREELAKAREEAVAEAERVETTRRQLEGDVAAARTSAAQHGAQSEHVLALEAELAGLRAQLDAERASWEAAASATATEVGVLRDEWAAARSEQQELSLALQEAHAQAERAAHSGDAARAEAEQKVQQLEESIRGLAYEHNLSSSLANPFESSRFEVISEVPSNVGFDVAVNIQPASNDDIASLLQRHCTTISAAHKVAPF